MVETSDSLSENSTALTNTESSTADKSAIEIPSSSQSVMAVEQKTEVKKVISPKNFSIGKPSIASMLNQSKTIEKEEVTNIANLRNLVFTEEQLQTSWAAYAKQVDEKGKTSLWHTLTVAKPTIGDTNQILFKVYNAVQESDVQAVLTDLSIQLRNDLQNDHIQIVLQVNKDETERKPYTNREKYMRLVQLNPILETFRSQLDLEI
jgi:DNA polymerase-3 subunit gamma/tau